MKIVGVGTAIQWCDDTVNPVSGCNGCELWNPGKGVFVCYAGTYTEAKRGYRGFKDRFTQDFMKPKLFPGRMAEAARRKDLSHTLRPKKPWLDGTRRLIFVSDMGDALSAKNAIDLNGNPVDGGGVPFDFLLDEVIRTALSPNGQRHVWLWLTKYPKRMAEFSRWLKREKELDWPANVWPGTSVTSSRVLTRVNDISQVGGQSTTRFVSIEPLSGDITARLRDELTRVGRQSWWMLVGGESRQGQDEVGEFRLEWARELIVTMLSMGIPVFLKQVGTRPTLGDEPYPVRDSHGGNWREWPADLRVRQIPNGAYPVGIQQNVPPTVKRRPKRQNAAVSTPRRPTNAAWTEEDVRKWTRGASPQTRAAILILTKDSLTTRELNVRVGASSGGAIVGGLLAYASRKRLARPLEKVRSRSGEDVYQFCTPESANTFLRVLSESDE